MSDEVVKLTRTDSNGNEVTSYPETLVENVEGFTDGMVAELAKYSNQSEVTYIPITGDYYYRPSLPASAKITVTLPKGLAVVVNNHFYKVLSNLVVYLNVAGSWDNSTYATASKRAGKDFYIYAVEKSASARAADNTPAIVLSANSTYPTGYTAATSRKIGGFHCLCASVGTISGHALSGYVTGDILPASVWDLRFRSSAGNEGMVYSPGLNAWVDIYLASHDGSSSRILRSVYNAVIADGASTVRMHWYNAAHSAGLSKKKLTSLHDFMHYAIGSNLQTAIKSEVDPNTTGGHVDTANRRMISNLGIEDCCGAMQQWGSEPGGPYSASSWVNAYDENSDAEMRGQHYNAPNRVVLGGAFSEAEYAGTRYNNWSFGPLALNAFTGVRLKADHVTC